MAVGWGEGRPVEIDEQCGFPSTGLDSLLGYYLLCFYFLRLLILHRHIWLLKFSSVSNLCVCVVIPYHSASGNQWIPANETVYLLILACSVFHEAELVLGMHMWKAKVFIHGVYFNENEWKCFFASTFYKLSRSSYLPLITIHTNGLVVNLSSIFRLCAGLGRRVCQTFRSENNIQWQKCFQEI